MPVITDDVRLAWDRLARSHGGAHNVTKEALVNAARSETSPFHEHFTWNAAEAHQKLLLIEAGNLMRRITFRIEPQTVEDMPLTVRYLQAPIATRGTGYRTTTDVLNDAESCDNMLRTFRVEIESEINRILGFSAVATTARQRVRVAVLKQVVRLLRQAVALLPTSRQNVRRSSSGS